MNTQKLSEILLIKIENHWTIRRKINTKRHLKGGFTKYIFFRTVNPRHRDKIAGQILHSPI